MSRALGNMRSNTPAESIGMAIVDELERLNDNIESGKINIRTHHPLCLGDQHANYTISQMDAINSFLAASIKSGALVVPPAGGGNVARDEGGKL